MLPSLPLEVRVIARTFAHRRHERRVHWADVVDNVTQVFPDAYGTVGSPSVCGYSHE